MNLQSTIQLHTGNAMPLLGLGTWQLTSNTADTIAQALKLGYPMIDTSGDYGTQPGIGQGIKKAGVARESFYLVTKVEEADDAYEAVRRNLGELGLEYSNLVLIHRPPQTGVGEQLWQGLVRAKAEGLTKDIGVSNYRTDQIQSLIDASGEVPTVNQIEWSPFGHSLDMLNYCRERNIVIQAYSPLAHAKKLNNETLRDIAETYGKSPAQILLRWNLQLGTVPLPKANRPEHLSENIDLFDFEISADDMATLNGLNEHYSALGALPYV